MEEGIGVPLPHALLPAAKGKKPDTSSSARQRKENTDPKERAKADGTWGGPLTQSRGGKGEKIVK